MTLYSVALFVHSYLRWIVLALALVVLVRFFLAWRSGRAWSPGDNSLHGAFVGIVDIQFTIGLLLYVWLSPLTTASFGDMGAAMRDPVLRFFTVEHVASMVVAITLIHITRGRSKRARTDTLRFRSIWISTLVALLIIAASIPWSFFPYARPLFR
jgi:hypothetical protein